MKKLLPTISLTILSGALVMGGFATALSNKKISRANADAPDYQTYVPLRTGWIENDGGGDAGAEFLNGLIRARNDRFWSGQASGWDSQERSFNALDEFIDTIHKAGGEGWKGAYRTPELVLHDNDHRYISFLFGGGEGDIFINIFQVSGAAGSGNRITNIKTAFNGSGYYEADSVVNPDKLNAPISCNMVFKYFELPNEIQPGDRFLIYVRDGKTENYGGFTFGDVHINQTLEEVAKSFSAHKAQIKLNEYMSDWTRNANEVVLNSYANDSYYATVRTAEAALTDANEDFELNNRLSKWAYDQENSVYENGDLANINFDYIYSDKDIKWGGHFYDNDGLMPVNKTGNMFLTGEPNDVDGPNTGLPESAKYRLVSPEFTLSGTGLISAKIGGHYARLSLLDSNYNVLLTTGNNPSFVDANMTNIIDSGARLCTMTRTYLDCSAYLNQRVHVAIEDSQTGGGWGLAYFDEIVTKYNTLPSFKLDVIHQNARSGATYNGVVRDRLVVGATYNATFKEAYDFVKAYLNQARSASYGFSWCIQTLDDVEDAYDTLSADAKAIVDASEDFHYGDARGQYSGDYFLAEVNKQYTIGQSMTAFKTDVYPEVSSSVIRSIVTKNNPALIAIIFVAGFICIIGMIALVYTRKKKAHNK